MVLRDDIHRECQVSGGIVMQKTLLIGNGINRIGQGPVSWGSLIDGLGREYGVVPQNMVDRVPNIGVRDRFPGRRKREAVIA